MPTLLETIQHNLRAAPQAAEPQVSETLRTQELIRAKGGRAQAPGTAPKISTVQEQVARAATRTQQKELQREGEVQAQAIEQQKREQEQQAELAGADLNERQLSQQEDFNRQTQALLSDVGRRRGELDFNKDKSKLEQIGFNVRLNSKQYVDQLNNEAARARLDDAAKFREELARSIFSEEEEMLRNDLSFRRVLDADESEFQRYLGSIDLDSALQLSRMESKAASGKQMWEGVGGLFRGGAQYYETHPDMFKSDDYQTEDLPSE